MATLMDKYVNSLVKANEARKADIQKQYDAWARKQQAAQAPAGEMAPVKMQAPVQQEIPVLKPYANDEAAQKAERAQQINNDFAGISNYINNAKAQKQQAAERQARKEEQTQQAQQQLFNDIEEYSKTYQKPTSNDQITMNADGTVDVASVKRDARKKAAQSNAKTETQPKDKTRLVMNDNGLPDMLAMKPEISNVSGQTLINNAMNGDKASRTVPELAKLGASPALKNAQNYTKAVVEYEKALENADARTKLQYYAQKWLDPAYSMTDQDKKQYEGLVKQWKKENPEGAKAWENNFDGEQYHWDFLNEYPEVRDLLDIKYKNDPVAAFANGLSSAFDFPWMVGTGIAKLFSDEEGDAKIDERSARRQQRIANAQSQHKLASNAGNLYGQAMWYALLDLAGGAAGIGGSGAAAGSTNLGSKLIPFLKEQGLQLAGDTVVQTAPVVARDIYNKEDLGTIAKDAGIDIGVNAATNLLMGAGGELLKKYSAGKAANTANQIQEVKSADEIAAETAKLTDSGKGLRDLDNEIESLKNGENTISTARAARLAEEANATMDQNTVLANALEDLRIRDARNARLAEEAAAQPINYRETLAKALEERPVSDAIRRTGNVTSDTAERAARSIAEEINESKVSALGRNPATGELSNYGNAIMRRLNELNGLSEARTAALNADPALKEAFGNAWTKYLTEFAKADAGQVNALKAATNELADVYESIGKVTGENANARRNLEDVYDILMHRNIPRKFEGDMPENINPILDMLDEQSRSNVENSLDTVRNYIDDTIYKNMRAIRGNETLQAKVKDVTDAYDKWIDAVYSGIGDTERLGKDVRNAMGRAERAFAKEGISAFHVPEKMAKQTNLPDMILKNNTPEGYVPPEIPVKSADVAETTTKAVAERIEPEAEMTIKLDSTKPKAETSVNMRNADGDEARIIIDPAKNTVEPAKSVTEPVQPDQPNMKTRGTYSNTMQNSDIFPEKELAENPHYAKEEFGYLEQSESESLEKASDILASNKEGQKRRFASEVLTPDTAKRVEASDIDSIYMMIRENNEAIENAIDAAEIARLRRENGIMTQNLARINTNAGQVVQANAKWSRTPEGMRIQADAFKKGKVDEILKEADWGGDVTRLEDNIVKRIDELIDSKMWDDLKASDGIDSEKGLNLIRDELAREINNAAAKVKKNISNTDVDNLAKKIQQKLLASPDIDKIEDQLMSDDIWQMVAGVGDITEEHMDEALKLLDEAKQFNPNSKDAAQRIDAAYLILANDIGHGKSIMDKLDAWRYFAMLSKPTTHLRNMLGNTTFGLVTGAENSLSAVMEAGLDRASKIARHGKGIDRTKSLLGPQDVDLIKACARDFNDNAYGLYKGNKYYDDLAAGIEKMVKTFDDKGAGKAANFLTETNTALLDAEDVLFGKSKYATSLAGYLKANGYGIDALKSEDTAIKRVVEDARAYALSKANEATFHNNSAFAKLTTEIDRGLREWSRLDWGNGNSVKKAVGLAGRHIVPFAKTPANILSSILSRGPQESGKVLYDLVQLAKHNPNVKAKDLIEDISKTASGTMILGLGAYLYSTGHIELGGETDNERFNKKPRGITGPSLKFGNTYVALNDGNVPTAILAMGANLAQAYKGKKGGLDAFLDGLASVSDTVVDTTMLSGLADVLNSARYSKDNADLASRIGMQVITNASGQYIPNLTRGLENVVDSEKRNTAYTGQTGVMDTAGKSLQYASTGIPFLQEGARAAKDSGIPILEDIGNVVALNPQVDRWGNDIEKVGGNALGRLANNTINPTSITTDQSNALDKEIDRLYKRLTDDTNGEPIMSVDDAKKLFTYTPNAESKFDGEPLSRDEWYKYQQERGKSRYDLMNAVVNSRYYRYLTDEEKATMLKEMDDISKNYTREKYGAEIKNKKMAKLVDAYKEGGAKAVLDIKGENIDTTRTPETRMKEYQKAKEEEQKFETASDDIMGTLKKAGVVDKYAESVPKEAREAYSEYGMQGVEDYATVKSNKKGASYEKYSSLKSEIPTLTAKEYADIYNNYSIPNKKGEYDNYFTKDTELIPYLTSRAWDNDEQLNIYAHALSPSVEGTWHIVNGKLYYNKPSVERWRDNGKEYSAENQARVNNVVSLFKK